MSFLLAAQNIEDKSTFIHEGGLQQLMLVLPGMAAAWRAVMNVCFAAT